MGRKRNEYAFLAMLITAGHYIVRQSLNIAIIEIAKPPKKEFVKVYNIEISSISYGPYGYNSDHYLQVNYKSRPNRVYALLPGCRKEFLSLFFIRVIFLENFQKQFY